MSQESEQKTKPKLEKKLYATPNIVATDELDRIKKVAYLYSCYRKVSGKSSKVLREKLILLLALYLKYGYNTETKEKAAKILVVDKEGINNMNQSLREGNYLLKDSMNIRINHLHEDLKVLSEFVKGSNNRLLFLFSIDNEK